MSLEHVLVGLIGAALVGACCGAAIGWVLIVRRRHDVVPGDDEWRAFWNREG